MKAIDKSFYQYRVIYGVSTIDGRKENRKYKVDTDILYRKLHFWNRDYLFEKCRKNLLDQIKNDPQIVTCEILEELFIPIHWIIYEMV